MPYGRSGVAVAIHHRLEWFIHLHAQGLSKADEHSLPDQIFPWHFQVFPISGNYVWNTLDTLACTHTHIHTIVLRLHYSYQDTRRIIWAKSSNRCYRWHINFSFCIILLAYGACRQTHWMAAKRYATSPMAVQWQHTMQTLQVASPHHVLGRHNHFGRMLNYGHGTDGLQHHFIPPWYHRCGHNKQT